MAKAAKFCQVCGITISVKEEDLSCVAQLEVEPSERKRHQTALLTFEEYRERKGKERTSRFVSKSSKRAKKESGENEVSIHIGFIRLKDGELKVIRGSSLPLKVLPSIGAEELLRKGAEKMVKFNSDLSLYEPSNFTLLYLDKTEVKYLPGGTEPFTLQRYRCRVNGSVPPGRYFTSVLSGYSNVKLLGSYKLRSLLNFTIFSAPFLRSSSAPIDGKTLSGNDDPRITFSSPSFNLIKPI